MKRVEAISIFTLAGIEALNSKPLPDGYSYSPDDERYYQMIPRLCWWFIKTPVGWIEIGWRKRVISINWEDTPVRKVVTADDVTKSDTLVHAYSVEKAIEYLRAFRLEMDGGRQK